MREIFRKVPLSEKKILFKKGSVDKMPFFVKGESDDLITLLLDEYVDGKVLTFNYAANSPRLFSNQQVVVNFTEGEDRYFFHTVAEVFSNRVHMAADLDVYVLQRRKSPRLEIPNAYPGTFNIISHQGKPVLYNCQFVDFSSGGCRVKYLGHLPVFKTGEIIRGVIHLNHRNPVELDCEIKHHAYDNEQGIQAFGIQFKLNTNILESKMLVVFMDLQRELFMKWSSGQG
jgi:hypothetical protein